ncbi:MAG: alanine racemase domain protein [Frankiales bacterium]|nr:alanine racemase domain protein [Frankiales bacterium]
MSGATRRGELAAALATVEDRIAAACAAAGRARGDVRWVAVSKTWPASDIVLLRDLGVRLFGENKDQEAAAKVSELAGTDLEWHFIGQLQTNKARSVASYASVVHTVDREKLARALSAGAERAGRLVEVLLQVSLDGDARRGGVAPADLAALAAVTAALPGLRLRGVMGVAPREGDARQAFEALVRQSHALRGDHPQADVISAGMSADLDQAVRAGATLLRVGTALFGHRSVPLR